MSHAEPALRLTEPTERRVGDQPGGPTLRAADDDGSARFQDELGERLRRVRRARGLTLQDVEDRSDGRWKAVVIGSYERGDRAVSAVKLAELADFYDVPAADLLHERGARPIGGPLGNVHLDADRVAQRAEHDPSVAPVARLLDHVRWQRGDHRSTVLAVRASDLESLAVAMGLRAEELPVWLEERRLLGD